MTALTDTAGDICVAATLRHDGSRPRRSLGTLWRHLQIAVCLTLLGGAAVEARAATSPPTTGLAVWLRADAGVTTTGGKVSGWADQSGAGRNATQGTAAARPTVIANALNGKPVISFNGTSTYLSFTYPVNGLTGMTVVMVSNNTANQSGGQWGNENAAVFWPQSASWGELHLSPFQTNVRFRFGTGQKSNLPSYTRPSSLGSAYSRTIAVKSGTTDQLYVNGTRVLNLTGKLGTIKNCQSAATIGRGGSPTIKYFKGNIAEILVYNRALTPAELTTVNTYLAERYFPTAGPPPAVAITRSGTSFLVDGQPFTMWGMRVASASQTQALTDQLIANLGAYKSSGLNTITVFYQGSSGGFTDPFSANGLGMNAGHKSRMEQIVKAARARGMIVVVGILYQRAVWVLNSATSVHNAMRTVATAMLPFRNVIINVANESNSAQYSDTNGIYNVNLPANIGALCADVHSIDPARLCGGGGFNDSHNVGVGLNANIDALLFSTDNVTPTSSAKYNHFVSQGVNNKPIVNVELFGGYTLNWPTPGVFDATAKGYYQNEVLAKLTRPVLSIFFFSEPWSQRAPIHYELGGQGTAADPGIKWYWDYVQQQTIASALGIPPSALSPAKVKRQQAARLRAAITAPDDRLEKTQVLLELGSPRRADRVAAVAKVARLAPGEAVEVLSAVFLSEPDTRVRSRAIGASMQIATPASTALLRRWTLEDADPALRARALYALVALSGERNTTIFGRVLRMDSDPRVRLTAIQALQRVGGDWARAYLERATHDADMRISSAAEQALAAWPEPLE